MKNDENVKSLEEQIDYEGAMIGIPLEEFVAIENAVQKALVKSKEAYLAANAEKKQAAIEETYEILKGLIVDG